MENEIDTFEFRIKDKIYTIRGYQVMLDRDLAELYGVQTKILNKAVKRNIERFPKSFCFKLTTDEVDSLRFQIGTLENRRGKHTKYLPYAFAEQGVAMLAGILRSETAVKISVAIIESFVEMRKLINSNAQIYQRLDRVEIKQIETDTKFDKVFSALVK
jgi:phage regulator Rha-like protein